MSYGLIYLRGDKMMLRRLDKNFVVQGETEVKDALDVAKRELVSPMTLGAVFIKEPGELFLLATMEGEVSADGPKTMVEMFTALEVDPTLRETFQQVVRGWFEALSVEVAAPIWES